MIPLTRLQKEIMRDFYSIQPTEVVYDYAERKKMWELAMSKKANGFE